MAEKDTTPARYAVMGNPVAHSKSPVIHKQFAHQFGHNIEYTALWVDTDGFAEAVEQFRAEGGKGLNITVPFKLEAYRLADNLSDRAKLAGAVNTIRFEPDGKIFGDNTDGTGLVHDLTKNLNVLLRGKKILVLGAGGAARGALGPLLKQNPAVLVIANRTVSKAKELAKTFAHIGKVEAVGYDDLGRQALRCRDQRHEREFERRGAAAAGEPVHLRGGRLRHDVRRQAHAVPGVGHAARRRDRRRRPRDAGGTGGGIVHALAWRAAGDETCDRRLAEGRIIFRRHESLDYLWRVVILPARDPSRQRPPSRTIVPGQ